MAKIAKKASKKASKSVVPRKHRDVFLEQGVRLLNRRGFDHVTMTNIDVAGCNKINQGPYPHAQPGDLYLYFTSKDQIVAEFLARQIEAVIGQVIKAIPAGTKPVAVSFVLKTVWSTLLVDLRPSRVLIQECMRRLATGLPEATVLIAVPRGAFRAQFVRFETHKRIRIVMPVDTLTLPKIKARLLVIDTIFTLFALALMLWAMDRSQGLTVSKAIGDDLSVILGMSLQKDDGSQSRVGSQSSAARELFELAHHLQQHGGLADLQSVLPSTAALEVIRWLLDKLYVERK